MESMNWKKRALLTVAAAGIGLTPTAALAQNTQQDQNAGRSQSNQVVTGTVRCERNSATDSGGNNTSSRGLLGLGSSNSSNGGLLGLGSSNSTNGNFSSSGSFSSTGTFGSNGTNSGFGANSSAANNGTGSFGSGNNGLGGFIQDLLRSLGLGNNNQVCPNGVFDSSR